jgi:hypothetical protein
MQALLCCEQPTDGEQVLLETLWVMLHQQAQ